MKTPPIETFGPEVPLTQVSRELRALWSVEGAGQKASLLNFAAYLEDPSRTTELDQILGEITKEHACRSFLLLANKEKNDPKVRAFIRAECQIRNGVKSVCSEQVTYLLEGTSPDLLRNTVFAHLDSDLPLAFLWTGELSELFEDRLYSIFDRFLFDSSEWKEPLKSFQRVLDALKHPSARFVAHDLSWTRTHQYRLALASIFDHPPAQTGLPSLDNVEIRHSAPAKTAAWLLASWIAFSLSGKLLAPLKAGDNWRIDRPGGIDLTVNFTQAESEAPISALICTGDNQKHAILREPGSNFLQITSQQNSHTLEHLLPADRRSPSALVSEQLKRSGANQLYLSVLKILLNITPD